MKLVALTALVALVGVGAVSADYESDRADYLVNNIETHDLTSMPATAAGKKDHEKMETMRSDQESGLPGGFIRNWDDGRPQL